MRIHRDLAAGLWVSLEDFTGRFILWYRNFQRVHRERLLNSPAPPPVRTMPAIEVSWGELVDKITILDGLKRELKAINEALWDIENRTRAKEAAKAFDQEFIGLTRSVYQNNDKRAGIKRRINELLNSGLIEEKQYTSY
jgi:hypothetical protein